MEIKRKTNLIGKQLIHFDELGSTNTYIKENANTLDNGAVVLTDYQFSGKGRLGRVWNVPKNSALTFSFLIKNPNRDMSLFPLLCAIAVVRCIKSFLQKENLNANVKIKWPNDIVINKKKLCGVLCESTICSGLINVICGIGVNINQPSSYFVESNLPFATSLAIELGKSYDKNDIFKNLVEELDDVFCDYFAHGFQQLKLEYVENLVNVEKEVEIIYKSNTIKATCLGICDNGNLICNHNGEIIYINSGEASVRGLYGYV